MSGESRRSLGPRAVALALLVLGVLLAGCGRQSIVSARSPQTHDIRTLWWWMLGVATVVFLGAVSMLALAWVRRGTRGLPFVGEREAAPQAMVVLFGIAIPLVVLITLFGVSDVYLVEQTAPPPARSTRLTIDVIGHQWWWEVHYPGTGAVTANEIHIPTATRVNVVATTADVIHSFWVPQLARKIDMVPGRQNRVLLYAAKPGRYRGQCAEFCGLQHANMALFVIAQSPAAFRTWLAAQAAPARIPATSAERRGEQLFMANQCASCHEIRGTSAQATVGPDLTHLASRRTLAAATLRNTPKNLLRWISDPQSVKPGDRMPDLALSRAQFTQILTYLESLR